MTFIGLLPQHQLRPSVVRLMRQSAGELPLPPRMGFHQIVHLKLQRFFTDLLLHSTRVCDPLLWSVARSARWTLTTYLSIPRRAIWSFFSSFTVSAQLEQWDKTVRVTTASSSFTLSLNLYSLLHNSDLCLLKAAHPAAILFEISLS